MQLPFASARAQGQTPPEKRQGKNNNKKRNYN
jgi:hypothetical protein